MLLSLLFIIALGVLATARITRFITVDKLAQPMRGWVVRKLGPDSQLVYLLHCPWCMSIWVAAAVTIPAWFLADMPDTLGITSWWGVPALWLAVAQLAALTLTDRKD